MKEEAPNTKNIAVWKKGAIEVNDRDDRINKKALINKRTSDSDSDSDKAESYPPAERKPWWNEKYDFTLFFFLGSLLWVWIVKTILRWLKFPVQKHSQEVYLFYTVPLVIMFGVLYLLDYLFSFSNKKLKLQQTRRRNISADINNKTT
jgi:hypothetical protein